MNRMQFEAEIVRAAGTTADVVHERVYGDVRMRAQWPEERGTPETRVAMEVCGDVDRLHAPGYVDLFFHDAYLLLNLATPGSFGGTVAISGPKLRVRELAFNARVFEYALGIERLPLEQVASWYDGLGLGTVQVANRGEATALFQLLHLARGEEDEESSIVRLASAVEALLGRPASLRRLFELREEIARGRTPVFHPMHDDGLDPRVEDALREWVDVADTAGSAVIRELQSRIRRGTMAG